MKNTEFHIPEWKTTSAEAGAVVAMQRSVKTETREATQSENEMILEILKIGNEIEALRTRKIGEKYVEFRKTTTRTTH